MKKMRRFGNMAIITALTAAIFICGSTMVSAASITKAKAKQLALSRANVKKEEVVKWTKVKLDNWDSDRQKEWDVEFRTSNYKYEIEINANSGKVEDYEREKIRTAKAPSTGKGNSASKSITKNEAVAAALKKAGVKNADVTKWIKVRQDEDEWEIDFQTADYRYEVDISARTGKVKDFEKKRIAVSSGQDIGLEQAKATALAHAKKQANIDGNVRYTKAKLDRDDGRQVYEIEFRSGWMEFEYDIDAASGQILEWDMEYDD